MWDYCLIYSLIAGIEEGNFTSAMGISCSPAKVQLISLRCSIHLKRCPDLSVMLQSCAGNRAPALRFGGRKTPPFLPQVLQFTSGFFFRREAVCLPHLPVCFYNKSKL